MAKSYSKYTILVCLFLSLMTNRLVQSQCTAPIVIDRDNIPCSYLNKFELSPPNRVVSAFGTIDQANRQYKVTYHNLNNQFDSYLGQDFTLRASDPEKVIHEYEFRSIHIVRPAQHRFENADLNPTKTIEVQAVFTRYNPDNVAWNSDVIDTAVVSYILTSEYPKLTIVDEKGKKEQRTETYLPNGNQMLQPFFQYGQFQNGLIADVNYASVFENIENFHYYYGYQGSQVGCSSTNSKKVYNYVNQMIYKVDQVFIDRYTFENVNSYEFPAPVKFDQDKILKICFSGFEETILRENYALWLFVLAIFLWWIFEISVENDTSEVFQEEYANNRWTSLPFYSMYKLNSDTFFTKMSRYTHYLAIFSWEVTLLSIFYSRLTFHHDIYDVTDAIILWYALAALLCTWPVGYFFGAIMYHTRQTYKEKVRLQLEWKGVQDKNSHEAVDIQKHIELEEGRVFTYYFIYYLLIFLFIIMCFCVSVWQNTYLDKVYQDYWVATIFLLLFLDICVFDVIAAFIPGPRFVKYRGYYYDYELAKLYKKLEEA